MRLLTEDARMICDHRTGKVKVEPSQDFVKIEGRLLLVENDPENKGISGCSNYNLTIQPCLRTLPVEKGYSELLRIDGHKVCLDIIEGRTDGTPYGTFKYFMIEPGQDFVGEIG